MTTQLPPQFAELEPFVRDWALATERERFHKRASSTWDDIVAFYGAISPRLAEICEHLDRVPMGPLDAGRRSLLFLSMMSMEVGLAIDFYKRPDPSDAFPRERLAIADLPHPESSAAA